MVFITDVAVTNVADEFESPRQRVARHLRRLFF